MLVQDNYKEGDVSYKFEGWRSEELQKELEENAVN